MTEHYVTLFDSTFLPQGLALHHSLLEHGGDFLLWVLCLDSECLAKLKQLKIPQMRLLDLADLETPELLAVKPYRTRAEYCWTLTPWSMKWVFEIESTAQRITYLDADLFFLKSPASIFEDYESSGSAVLITEHSYAPEYDYSHAAGRFCVQFLTISRGQGEIVLNWWGQRCLEWCYAKQEDGKFGDQKYLESFSGILPGKVLEISDDPRFQAPWNSIAYSCSRAVIFHFHGLRIQEKGWIYLTQYLLPKPTLENIYIPYVSLLKELVDKYQLAYPVQKKRESLASRLARKPISWMREKILSRKLPPYEYRIS